MSEGATIRTTGVLQDPLPFVSRNRRRWVWGVSLVVLLVYLAGISPHWWVGEDGALYLCLGRNLALGKGYTLAGEAHTLVPPGYPGLLAVLMRIGADSFLAMNVVMGLMGLGSAVVCYLLLRELVHRDWALLLGGLFALSNELFQRSGEVLSDVPLTLMVLMAIWLYMRGLRVERADRRGWEIASLLLIAACWVHLRGLPLAVGAGIGLVISAWGSARKRAILNLLIVALGILGTMALFSHYAQTHAGPDAGTYVGALRHYAGSLSLWDRVLIPFQRVYEGSREFSRLLARQKMPGYLCILLLVIPVAAAMLRRIRRRDCVGPLMIACYIAGMCAALSTITTRYLLPLFPLLVVYLLEAYVWIAGHIWKRRARTERIVAISLMVIIVGSNFPLIARNIYRKHRGDYVANQQHGKWNELPPTVEFIKANRTEGGAIIGDYAYAYLADMERPLISRQMRYSAVTDEQLMTLLGRWDVRFVVFNDRDELRPFDAKLREYLELSGGPVFEYGRVHVYSVDQGARGAGQ